MNTTTCVCCFLLLLVLSYELLTHCCFVNLCRSMKKYFKDNKKEASVWCIHVATSYNDACSRVNNFSLLNERLLFVLKCPYRCLIMPAFSRLKIPFWKNSFVWLHIKICFPCNVKYRKNTGSWIRNQHYLIVLLNYVNKINTLRELYYRTRWTKI